MRLVALVPSFLLLAGCPDQPGDDTNGKDGTDPGDSGDSGNIDYGDPGCINLDGETGDFETIGDAVYAAMESGRGTVNVCAGNYTESVSVPGGITVVGEGAEVTFIDAPSNTPAFTLSGDGPGVAGLTVQSTRSGIVVESATNVSISDVTFDRVDNYGIEVGSSENVVVTASTFVEPAYGGVLVSSASVSIDGSLFSEPMDYGVQVAGNGSATLTNNIFDQVHSDGDCSDLSTCSGVAIHSNGGDLVMSGNTITTTDLIGIVALDGSLSMSGDLMRDNGYAIFSIDANFSADGVEVYGSQVAGILAVHPNATITVANSIIAINEEEGGSLEGYSPDYDEGTYLGTGLWIQGVAAELTNVTIRDYENFGLYVGPYNTGDTPAVTVAGLTLDNNARTGARFDSAVGTINALSITNNREVDSTLAGLCTWTYSDGYDYTFVDRGAALVAAYAELTITDSTLADNYGWGLSNVYGDVSFEGGTLANNGCAGVMNFYATTEMSGATLSGYAAYGTFHSEYGEVVLTGNTFVDTMGSYTYTYVNDFTGDVSEYIYDYEGTDISSYYDNAFVATNNTFTGGGSGMTLYGSPATIEGNAWTDYNGALVQAYYQDEGDPAVIVNNTATDFGGEAVYLVYGSAEVSGFEIGTTREYNYGYHYYTNGVLDYEYTGSYATSLFSGYGYYYGYWTDGDGDGTYDSYVDSSTEANLKLEDVTVGTAVGSVVNVNNVALEIAGLSIETTAGYGVYDYGYGLPPQIEIEGLSVGQSTYNAVYLDWSSTDQGYVSLSDIDVQVSGGTAITLSGFHDWLMEDVNVIDASGYGIYVDHDYSFYDYYQAASVSGTAEGVGLVDGVELSASTYDGLYIDGGTVTIVDAISTLNTGNGLSLSDSSADVQGNAFGANEGYGMSCSNVTLVACAGNDLSDNTLGPVLDCDEACGI
ncbi:MAG: right-handed parallel beta-helix repeat-containing protein [Deltaproteobacteria bacterium]|nr:right-handed parallel beta-helix repeat-containing protein [Deltaproteobacteria bacterium]